MKKRIIINEIFIIRAIACISVVLIHSLSSAKITFDTSPFVSDIISMVSLLLMFATPTFIFLSEFLLSNSYQDKLPNNFFLKRIKFLLIPYVSIGVVFAAISVENFTFKNWLIESFFNVFLTDYYGYFIIIIFQFYILHWLFSKYLKNLPSNKMILYSFLFNILYLSIFNLLSPNSDSFLIIAIWNKLSYMPFLAWIFYFTLGYYAGRDYQGFVNKLHSNKIKVFSFAIFSVVLLIFSQYIGVFDKVWSKRPDIVIYTFGILLLIFYFSSKIKKIPNFIYTVSNYSFNIFLMHLIFIVIIEKTKLEINLILYISIVFIISLLSSIIVAFFLNKLPFGSYIIGNTLRFKPNRQK